MSNRNRALKWGLRGGTARPSAGKCSKPELLAELAYEAQVEGWNGVCICFSNAILTPFKLVLTPV
jgi:hypothetical protein